MAFLHLGLQENITIYKDGTLLQDIIPEHWNDFLRDLILPGVANLFFFDGEQIQALANDDTEAESLQEAVKGFTVLYYASGAHEQGSQKIEANKALHLIVRLL